MAAKGIIALNEEGWVTNSYRMLEHIISNYILTDAAQSYLFSRNLVSLPRTYFFHINEPLEMSMAIKRDLEKLLSYYFSNVEVYAEAVPRENSGRYSIKISAVCIDSENRRIELSRITEMNEGNVLSILNGE